MSAIQNTAVHLLGFPGCGKLTIARALCNRMDAVLIDSHLINNPVFRVLKADGLTPLPQAAWQLTHKIRMAVLEAIETCAPQGSNYIFTNAPTEDDETEMRAMRDVFARCGLVYIPVYLQCAEDELVRRRTAPGRKEQLKDTNPDKARRDAREGKLLHIAHENEMTLDVTDLSPDQAAEKIFAHIEKVART